MKKIQNYEILEKILRTMFVFQKFSKSDEQITKILLTSYEFLKRGNMASETIRHMITFCVCVSFIESTKTFRTNRTTKTNGHQHVFIDV